IESPCELLTTQAATRRQLYTLTLMSHAGSGNGVPGSNMISIFERDLAALHYKYHSLELSDIGDRISADRDNIGEAPSGDGAYPVGPSKQVRGVGCRCLNRLHWRHSKLHHNREFAGVQPVWIYRGIGAEGDFHTRFERPGNVLARGRHDNPGLLNHEFRHADSLIILHKPIAKVDRWNKTRPVPFH